MAVEHGTQTTTPVSEMTQRERLDKIRDLTFSLHRCIHAEMNEKHTKHISYYTWNHTIAPIQEMIDKAKEVFDVFYDEFLNPPAEAPANPPANPPAGGIDPSDLSQGWTPPAGGGDGNA